jgi:aminoglycoside phosphotransferase (APT) family kinase protein
MFGLPFPKVRGQVIDAAGTGSFDMNYIPGRSIADAVLNGGTFDPAALVKAVERLMSLCTMSIAGELPAGLFEEKIRDVAIRFAALVADADLRRSIGNCAQLLLLKDWQGVPQSPCHGDLTLENILLTTGKSIAFIDCDDPFVSSYWLDFGKLFQDIDGHWCIRTLYEPGAGGVRLLGARQKLDMLGARLRLLAADLDDRLVARLPQLTALSLYRAIPYARSNSLISFLCRRIARVLET